MTSTTKRRLRACGYAANVLLSAGTLAAGYGGMVNPDTSTIPSILSLTFPGWAVLEIIALAVCMLWHRRMAVIPALTLTAVLGPLLAFAPLNFPRYNVSRAQQDSRFTVVSYNLLGFSNFGHLYSEENPCPPYSELIRQMESGKVNGSAEYLIHAAPDLACLQECPPMLEYAPHYISKAMEDSLKQIFPYRTGENGENIFSRFRLKPVTLRQPESIYSWFGGAIVDIMGHETLVVSIHLQSIGLNDDDKELFARLTEGEATTKVRAVKRQLLSKLSHAFRERAQQARLLREQIDSLGIENVIVAGDFNDIPDCYAMRIIAGNDFKSAFTEAGRGPTYTYHGNRFLFNIDHVLYRGDMEAIGYRRIKTGWSDHYPVSVDFYWKHSNKQ